MFNNDNFRSRVDDCGADLSLDALKKAMERLMAHRPDPPEIISMKHWWLAEQRGYIKNGAKCYALPPGEEAIWYLKAYCDWERWSVGMFTQEENDEYEAHIKEIQEQNEAETL